MHSKINIIGMKTLLYISSLISSFSIFILVYLVKSYLNMSTSAVFVVVLMAYLPFVIFGIHAGYWCDKYSFKSINIYTSIILALATVLYLVTLNSNGHLFTIICISFVSLFVNTYAFILSLSIGSNVSRIFGREEWSKVNATLWFYRTAGFVSGPFLGGLVASPEYIYGSSYIFILCSITSLVFSVLTPGPKAFKAITRILNIKELITFSFSHINKNRSLLLMLGHGSLSNFVTGIIEVSIYLLLLNVYTLDPRIIGILFIFRQFGGLIASKLLSHITVNIPIKIQLIIVSVMNGLLWQLVATLPNSEYSKYAIASIFFIISFNSAIFNLIMTTFRMSLVSTEEQGRSLAAVRLVLFASFPFGIMLGYVLLELLSLRHIYLISGGIIALTSVLIIKINIDSNTNHESA